MNNNGKYYAIDIFEAFEDVMYVKAASKEEAEAVAVSLMQNGRFEADVLSDRYEDIEAYSYDDEGYDYNPAEGNWIQSFDADEFYEEDIKYGRECLDIGIEDYQQELAAERTENIKEFLKQCISETEDEEYKNYLQERLNIIK